MLSDRNADGHFYDEIGYCFHYIKGYESEC